MLENVLIGVLSSVIASVIFLTLLFTLRPKIICSPFIADQSEQVNETSFAVKIFNQSRFGAVGLEIEMSIVTPTLISGGISMAMHSIALKKTKLFFLEKFDRSDKDAKYAVRFSTKEDLRALCTNHLQYILVEVTAKHSLSGFSKTFSFRLNPFTAIKKGRHEFGENLDVISEVMH